MVADMLGLILSKPRTFINAKYKKIKKYFITPNPTRKLEWTVILSEELIGARIYMFRLAEAPSSEFIKSLNND